MSAVEGVTIDDQGRLIWEGRIYAAVDEESADAVKDIEAEQQKAAEKAAAEEAERKKKAEEEAAAAAAKKKAEEEAAAAKKRAAEEEAAKKKAAAAAAAAAEEKPAAVNGVQKQAVYDGPAMSLEEAWNDLVNERTPTNWVLYGVPKRKLEFIAKGDDGIAGLLPYFSDDQVLFAGLRVYAVDEQENVTSKRVKYVSVHFVGNAVKGIKRMGALQHRGSIERLMNGAALTCQYGDAGSLNLKSIAKDLLAAGGAHKPTYYSCGEGDSENERVPLEALYDDF